jgi:hypothetical protein
MIGRSYFAGLCLNKGQRTVNKTGPVELHKHKGGSFFFCTNKTQHVDEQVRVCLQADKDRTLQVRHIHAVHATRLAMQGPQVHSRCRHFLRVVYSLLPPPPRMFRKYQYVTEHLLLTGPDASHSALLCFQRYWMPVGERTAFNTCSWGPRVCCDLAECSSPVLHHVIVHPGVFLPTNMSTSCLFSTNCRTAMRRLKQTTDPNAQSSRYKTSLPPFSMPFFSHL